MANDPEFLWLLLSEMQIFMLIKEIFYLVQEILFNFHKNLLSVAQ